MTGIDWSLIGAIRLIDMPCVQEAGVRARNGIERSGEIARLRHIDRAVEAKFPYEASPIYLDDQPEGGEEFSAWSYTRGEFRDSIERSISSSWIHRTVKDEAEDPLSDEDWLRIKNVGQVTLFAIHSALDEIGLTTRPRGSQGN